MPNPTSSAAEVAGHTADHGLDTVVALTGINPWVSALLILAVVAVTVSLIHAKWGLWGKSARSPTPSAASNQAALQARNDDASTLVASITAFARAIDHLAEENGRQLSLHQSTMEGFAAAIRDVTEGVRDLIAQNTTIISRLPDCDGCHAAALATRTSTALAAPDCETCPFMQSAQSGQ